ncbi:hypothetical protein V8B55DRAFT_1575591 [Mucor lusitanicus]|uniref:HNH nuclease domain-containing protein n=1 Tax=Mucor lusitanicus CBS 277.49 TaxID=747725 RepID=A0A168Q360_MUCCL|nr:hypothetical protein MUCCIDRAFT_105587 [Mucor lusitanicus CBS 277.49]
MDNSDDDFQPPLPMPPRGGPEAVRGGGGPVRRQQRPARAARRHEIEPQAANVEIPIYENRNLADLPGEEWRFLPLPFVNFQVSNLGRIKGMLRIRRQRTLVRSTDPRLRVATNIRTEYNYRLVDDLVLLAFNNEDARRRQNAPFIIHLDGDPKNNRLENLRRATWDEYHQHDDNLRQGLPRRRIIRSRRFQVQHNPLVIHTASPNYIAPRYVYENGQLSNLYREGSMVTQRLNVSGIARVDITVNGRSMSPPVAELVLDSFHGYDPDRQLIIYNDGDVTNLNLANLQPATRDEYAQHISNSLRATPEEEFRPVRHVSDVDMTHYLVSNRGRIYSTKTRTFLSWYESPQAYAAVILYHNTMSIYFAVHRLVWSAFHDRAIRPGFVIDHLDMDRQNNDINNLEEVTPQENALRAVRARQNWLDTLTTAQLREIEDEQQELRQGERWLPARIIQGDSRFPLPEFGYEVSDQGRVRNAQSGRILRPGSGNFGYLHVGLNGRSFRVNRLVASTFLENTDPGTLLYVDHINGDRTNNFASNLRWVSPQENTRFSHGVRIRAYRADLNQEHTFNSIQEAGQFNFNGQRFAVTTIKDRLKRGTPLHGWFFTRENDAATERQEETELLLEDQSLAPAQGEEDERVVLLDTELDPLTRTV